MGHDGNTDEFGETIRYMLSRFLIVCDGVRLLELCAVKTRSLWL